MVLLETPGVVGTNMTGNGPTSCQKYLVLLPERQMETSQGLVENTCCYHHEHSRKRPEVFIENTQFCRQILLRSP